MPKIVEFSGRPDNRPEAFDLRQGARTNCDQCLLDGTQPPGGYGYRDVVIVHALNSPYGDGIHHHICIGHLKSFEVLKGIVIGDPNDINEDGMAARDLDGKTWREK